MAYNIQTIDSISESEFNSIWEDCKDVIETETFPPAVVRSFNETNTKKTVFGLFNIMCDIKFKIQKDDLDVAFLAGTKVDNTLSVGPALFGNDSQGSKSWLYDADGWSILKDYVIENNCTTFEGNAIKNSTMYNMLVYVGNNSIYPNSTLELSDRTIGGITSTSIKFVHD